MRSMETLEYDDMDETLSPVLVSVSRTCLFRP